MGMGISAVLRDEAGKQVRDLVDPGEGTFDAAGDFDGVLPQRDSDFALLKYVDPYGDTVFNATQMPDLLGDIARLRGDELRPVEERGLARLHVIAERCRDGVHLYVWFSGD